MSDQKQKIAIIGSGVSGLTSAFMLSHKHDVHVLEKDSRIGGHTATKDIHHNGRDYAIDTGFIVYNDRTYPNFIRLLKLLGVQTKASAMSFSVASQNPDLEYAGTGLNALFAQRRNIVSPSFWRMLYDIVRFNKRAEQDLQSAKVDNTITLGEYLINGRYSQAFCQHYLIPMGAAIWSASFKQMKQFPLLFFVRFFSNHGLLTVFDKPQWRVINGGSREYLAPLCAPFADNIRTGVNIKQVSRAAKNVTIEFDDGSKEIFDQVIFATHSDQALALLADPTAAETEILGAIKYQQNSVILHHDTALLPKRKPVWSSWNYRMGEENSLPSLTYNMNILQGIESDTTFCVTLNADDDIDTNKVLGRYHYAHPQFSIAAVQAQARKNAISGHNNTHYCGAYWANGFHEDGVSSAIDVAADFGISLDDCQPASPVYSTKASATAKLKAEPEAESIT